MREEKTYNVVASTWFTQMGGQLMGVVAVETEYDGLEFRIGIGAGYNQKTDEQFIAKCGAHFPFSAGVELLGEPL